MRSNLRSGLSSVLRVGIIAGCGITTVACPALAIVTVEIISPPGDITTYTKHEFPNKEAILTISGTASSDEAPLKNIKGFANGFGPFFAIPLSGQADTWEMTAGISVLSENSPQITRIDLLAEDESGLTNFLFTSFVHTRILDKNDPTLNAALEGGSKIMTKKEAQTAKIVLNYADNFVVGEIKVSGSSSFNIPINNKSGSRSISLSNFPEGKYTLKFTAVDLAGNSSNVASVSFAIGISADTDSARFYYKPGGVSFSGGKYSASIKSRIASPTKTISNTRTQIVGSGQAISPPQQPFPQDIVICDLNQSKGPIISNACFSLDGNLLGVSLPANTTNKPKPSGTSFAVEIAPPHNFLEATLTGFEIVLEAPTLSESRIKACEDKEGEFIPSPSGPAGKVKISIRKASRASAIDGASFSEISERNIFFNGNPIKTITSGLSTRTSLPYIQAKYELSPAKDGEEFIHGNCVTPQGSTEIISKGIMSKFVVGDLQGASIALIKDRARRTFHSGILPVGTAIGFENGSSLSFTLVTVAGDAFVGESIIPLSTPRFRSLTDDVFYDFQTEAEFIGDIEVKIPIDTTGLSSEQLEKIQIFHCIGISNVCVGIPTTVIGGIAQATVSSLGMLTVLVPVPTSVPPGGVVFGKDLAPPSTKLVLEGSSFTDEDQRLFISEETPIKLEAIDSRGIASIPAGVDKTYLSFSEIFIDSTTTPVEIYGSAFNRAEGIHTIHFFSVDNNANSEFTLNLNTQILNVDATIPETTYTLSGPQVIGVNGSSVIAPSSQFVLTSTDPVSKNVSSGINATFFLDNLTLQDCGIDLNGPVNINIDPQAPSGSCANPLYNPLDSHNLSAGSHTLTFLAIDNVENNGDPQIQGVTMDPEPPDAIAASLTDGAVLTSQQPLLSATLSDTVAGMSTATLSISIDNTTIPVTISHNAASELGDFTAGTPLLQSIHTHGVASSGNTVYITGGWNGSKTVDTVYRANVAIDGTISSWVLDAQRLPQTVNQNSAITSNGRLYVIGSGQDRSVYYADINPADGSLSQFKTGLAYEQSGASFIVGVAAPQICGNYLYIIGGSPLKSRVRVSRLDAVTGAPGPWRDTTAMPFATADMPVVEHAGKLYVIAGREAFQDSVIHDEVLVGTPDMNGDLTWTTDRSLPVTLTSHGAVAHGDLLIVFGGANSRFNGPAVDAVYTTRFTSSGLEPWVLSDKKLLTKIWAKGVIVNNHLIVPGGLATPPGRFDTTDVVSIAPLGSGGAVPSEATIVGAPTEPLEEGAHTLTLTAKDRVGNGGAETITFTIDSVPPSVTALTSEGKSLQDRLVWVQSVRPVITASYIDPSPGTGIDTAKARLLVNSIDVTQDAVFGANSMTYTPSADLGEGPHELVLTLADVAGNETLVSINFGVDTAAPANSGFTPIDGAVLAIGTIPLSAVFTDELSGLSTATARFIIDGSTLLPTALDFAAGAELGDFSAGTPLIQSIYTHGVAASGNTIYITGGWDGSKRVNTIYRASVADDGSIGSWVLDEQRLPNVVDQNVSIGSNERLYVIGSGQDRSVYYADINSDGSLNPFKTGLAYEQSGASFFSGVSAPQICGNYLYVMGGSALRSRVRVSRLNAETGAPGPWRDTTAMPFSTAIMPVVEHAGKLYVLGGREVFSDAVIHNEVIVGTPDENGDLTWTTDRSMPVPLMSHGAVSHGDLLVIFGGATSRFGGPAIDTVYTTRFTSSGLDPWVLSDKKLLTKIWARGVVINNHLIVPGGLSTPPGRFQTTNVVSVAPLGGGGLLDVSFTASATGLTEGVHAFRTEIEDLAGNVGLSLSTFSLDGTPPDSSLVVDGGSRTFSNTLYVRGQVSISVVGVDEIAGVAGTQIQIDGGGFNAFATPFALTDGTHLIEFFSTDLVGNVEDTKQQTVIVDQTGPPAVTTLGGVSLTSTSIRLTYAGTEDLLDAAVKVHYSTNFIAPSTTAAQVTLDLQALSLGEQREVLITGLANSTTYQLALFLRDTAGNWSGASNIAEVQTRVVSASADGVATITAPEPIAVEIVSVEVASEPFTVAVDSQAISPVTNEFYEFEDGLIFPPDDPAIISFSFDPTIIDSTSFSIYTFDETLMIWSSASVVNQTIVIVSANAGIISGEIFHTSLYAPFIRDLAAPLTALSIRGPTFNEFISTASAVVLTAVDKAPLGGVPSGISATFFNSQIYSTPFSLPKGPQTITFHSVDKIGNLEKAQSESFIVDGTSPLTKLSVEGSTLLITAEDELSLSATDGGSGVAAILLSIDGGAFASTAEPFSLPKGVHTLDFFAVDNVANAQAPTRVTVGVDLDGLIAVIAAPGGPNICRVVQGVVKIFGMASSNYTLEADGQVFASGGPVLDGGVLGSYDATNVSGEKTITLRVADVFGRENVASVTLFVGEPERNLVLGSRRLIHGTHDVEAGKNDRIIVADSHQHRILVFEADGTLAATHGSRKSKDEPYLRKPKAVALDASGNFWIADSNHHRIVKLDSQGEFLFDIGRVTIKRGRKKFKAGIREGEFRRPRGIAVGPKGNVYVSDTYNSRIQVFKPDGSFVNTFLLPESSEEMGKEEDDDSDGMDDATSENRGRPHGIAVDDASRIYVADPRSRQVISFDRLGKVLRTFGGSTEPPTNDDGDEEEKGKDKDKEKDKQKEKKKEPKKGKKKKNHIKHNKGTTAKKVIPLGQLKHPEGVAVSPDGNCIFVSDRANNRITRFDAEGNASYAFGRKGRIKRKKALSKETVFHHPLGLALTPEGELLVADHSNRKIQRFALPEGKPTLVVPAEDEAAPAERWIEPSVGGKISGKNRASISVPPDALDLEEVIEVLAPEESSDRNDAFETILLAAAGNAVQFEPAGLQFERPVTIELPYDAEFPDVGIYYWNESLGRWDALSSDVDAAASVVRAQTDHFSIYQVAGPKALDPSASVVAADETFVLRELYVFPNPAERGVKPTFHIAVGIADSVNVRVYDVSGRLVHSETMIGAPSVVNGNYAYRAEWNGRIASGVYLYVIRAKKGGHGDIRRSGKFAVVR